MICLRNLVGAIHELPVGAIHELPVGAIHELPVGAIHELPLLISGIAIASESYLNSATPKMELLLRFWVILHPVFSRLPPLLH